MKLRENYASYLVNIFLCIVFSLFAYSFLKSLIDKFSYSVFLLFFKEVIVAIFFLIRSKAKEVSNKPYEWVLALFAVYLGLTFRPVEGINESYLLVVLQIVGHAISVAGVISLNRSLGILPANRGVKSSGAYLFVRHPIYLGYILSLAAFTINNYSWQNLMMLVLIILVLAIRILFEERILIKDEDYKKYCKKVKYRLLPWIF